MRTLFLLFTFISLTCRLGAQQWQWIRNIQPASSYSNRMAEDAAGNVYITGTFTGSIAFGATTLNSNTEASYVAKINAQGNYIWAFKVNGLIKSIAAANHLAIAGTFTGTASFGSSSLSASGSELNGFVADYDLNGNLIWARKAACAGNSAINEVAVNNNAEVFVTGNTDTTMQIGTGVFGNGGFIAILNASGLVNKFEFGRATDAREIAIDNSDNIFILVDYLRQINLQDTSYDNGNYSPYSSNAIVKFNRNFNRIWSYSRGSCYYTAAKNLVVNSQGECYVSQDHRYGSITVTKYSPSGLVHWDKNYGGSVYDSCDDLQIDDQDNVYLTGGFWYNATYATASLSGTGSLLFIVKLDSSGSVCGWAEKGQPSPNTNGYFSWSKVSFRSSGGGYLYGNTSVPSQLGPYTVSSIFLTRISFNTVTSAAQENKHEEKPNLYPNPSNGRFYLAGIEDAALIKIYDVNGRCVYRGQVANEGIDFSGKEKGVYTAEINTKGKIYYSKLIIQ